MLIRRFLNSLRVLFLLLAAVSVGTYVFWSDLKPHVKTLDDGFVRLHLRDPKKQLEVGRDLMGKGEHEAAVAVLSSIADELRDVRYGDRRGWIRMSALRVLAKHNQLAGNPDESLRWVDELLRYDPHDIPAIRQRAELLGSLGLKVAERAQLDELYRVGAASGLVQNQYFESLADAGRHERLAHSILVLGGASPLHVPLTGWEFRATDTDSFVGKGRHAFVITQRLRDGLFVASLRLDGAPRNVATARIDLPPRSVVTMESMRCTFVRGDGSETVATLAQTKARVQVVPLSEGATALRAFGDDDPYIVFAPGEAALEGVVSVKLEFQLAATLPQQLAAAVRPAMTGDARVRLVERFGEEAVERMEASLDH